jgi:carboxymethylenebutenolidase
MPETLTLTASDGHSFSAYMAEPEDKPLGAIVVIQEVFGVNVHIRDVTERWAAVGYKAIAPALYDRFEPGFEVGYEPDDIARGREFKAKANEVLDKVILDVEAARAAVADAGKIGITGFCWGGFVTYVAACRLDFQAAAGYYGGGIADMLDEKPKCPTILHFGDSDASIPLEDVEKVRAANTGAEIFIYQAGHGFHCDMRGSFDPRAANIAAMRTTQLFERNLR